MTKTDIIALLHASSVSVEKAILFLQQQQTEDERATHSTRHKNGRGWSAGEESFGASLAQWINSGRHFSPAQLRCARKMAVRHARQLAELGCFEPKETIDEKFYRPIHSQGVEFVDASRYSHGETEAMEWAIYDRDPFASASVSPPCSAR